MAHDLGDLPALLESEDLNLVALLTGVSRSPDGEELSLTFCLVDGDTVFGERVVECRGVRRWLLEEGIVYSLSLAGHGHPALLPYTDAQAELYFKGRPADPERTAAELRAAAAAITGRFVHFESAVNNWGLAVTLERGYGKLATGPATLLRAFAGILAAEGLTTSLLPLREPEANGDPAVLELGTSWVVAGGFAVREA